MGIHLLKYAGELVFREVTKPVQSRRLTTRGEGQDELLGRQGTLVQSYSKVGLNKPAGVRVRSVGRSESWAGERLSKKLKNA